MTASAAPLVLRLRALSRPMALLLATGAGALAALAFPPVEVLAGAVIGLALLLLLLHLRPRGEAFALGFGFGLGHFAAGLGWIATAFNYQAQMPVWLGWAAVAGLAAFLALYPAFAALLARRWVSRLVPLALAFAALFVATEIARGLLLTGFAWNPLGAAWLQLPGVASLAAIAGASGLSGLMVLAGGSLAALAAGRGEAGRLALVLVFPLLLAVGAIVQRAQQARPATGPLLLLVQTGTGIADKHAAGGLMRSLETAVTATRAALAEGPPPAAVIWPEATIEFPLEETPGLGAQLTEGFAPQTRLLAGGVAIERDADGAVAGARNSLYALDYRGRILARYDKAHLVPGGEYLPLRVIAEPLGLARLVPGSLDFLPGPGPVTWRLPGLPPLSPNICYEIIFPAAVVDRADRPSFIVTVSNDAWFGRAGPPQHFAQARLRAIEEGLPVVRVTPTGISGVVDARGRVLLVLPRHVSATARARLPAAAPPTPFSRLGLLAPALLAIFLGLAALAVARLDKKT